MFFNMLHNIIFYKVVKYILTKLPGTKHIWQNPNAFAAILTLGKYGVID